MRVRMPLLLASLVALTLCGCVSVPDYRPQPSHATESVQTSEPVQEAKSNSPKPTQSYKPASADGPAANVPIPKLPIEATKSSEKGAATFVDYYFDLVNYVGETYDTKTIKLVTTRQCEVCGVSIIDRADRGKELEAWQVGGKHHHRIVDAHMPTSKRAAVTVKYWVDSSVGYRQPNVPDMNLKAVPKGELIIELIYRDRWKVDKISGAS